LKLFEHLVRISFIRLVLFSRQFAAEILQKFCDRRPSLYCVQFQFIPVNNITRRHSASLWRSLSRVKSQNVAHQRPVCNMRIYRETYRGLNFNSFTYKFHQDCKSTRIYEAAFKRRIHDPTNCYTILYTE